MGEKGTKGWAMIKSDSWRWMESHGWRAEGDSSGRRPDTGQSAVWDEDKGQWLDSATGQALTPDPNAVS